MLRTAFLAIAAALPAIAQIVPPEPPPLSIYHAARHVSATTEETGVAPESLIVADLWGAEWRGEFDRAAPVVFRIRQTGISAARDLTVVKPGPGPTAWVLLVPAGFPAGAAEIVAVQGDKFWISRIWVVPSNFGVFARNGSFGAAAAHNYSTGGEPSLNGLTNPARPGLFVSLWGTGLGDGAPVTVEVAGTEVAPDYAGRAPGLPGVDQVNFRMPDPVPEDCYVPVLVKVAGRAANRVTLSTAGPDGGPCRHRLHLSAADLRTLDDGGTVPIGQLNIYSGTHPQFEKPGRYFRQDGVQFLMHPYDAGGVESVTRAFDPAPTSEGCRIQPPSTGAIFGLIGGGGEPLESGKPLVTFPNGSQWELDGFFGRFDRFTGNPPDGYPIEAIPPPTFAGGYWTLRLPGGRTVADFQIVFSVPPPLRWTNRPASDVLPRGRDLLLSWDPSGYSAIDTVRVNLYPNSQPTGSIDCSAPATAGAVTVPAALMAEWPAEVAGNQALISLRLDHPRTAADEFAIPLATGGWFPGVVNVYYSEDVQVRIE